MSIKSEIEKTSWAKRLKRDCPTSYDEAIKIASLDPCIVFISHTRDTGEWKWAVISDKVPDFWLDAFDSEHEARAFVKKMKWIETE